MSSPKKVYLVSYQEKTNKGIQLRVVGYFSRYQAKQAKGLLVDKQLTQESIIAIHDILPVEIKG